MTDLSTIIGVAGASIAILGAVYSAFRWISNSTERIGRRIEDLESALQVKRTVLFPNDMLVEAPKMRGGVMMVQAGSTGDLEAVNRGVATVTLAGSTTEVYVQLSLLRLG